MRKITFLIVVTLFFLFFPKSHCFAESLPERFVQIVQSLESYAFKQGIKLERNENIKDVVTLGYLNAVNRLKIPFGHMDEKVKKETVEWLSILCWFPIIPPEKKQKAEPVRVEKKVGRNDPCPCGSGKKYKNCHGKNEVSN